MELYEKCLGVLETAETDTEKFAALLLIQRTLKLDSVPQNFRKQVFKAAGSVFFSRLLHTDIVPEGCPPFIFKSVCFSVLASLLSDSEDTEVIDIIIQEIDTIKQILTIAPKFQEEEKMFEDIVYCLNAAVSNEEAQKKLIEQDIVTVLVETFHFNPCVSGKCLDMITCLLSECPRDTWFFSGHSLYHLLEKLTSCLNVGEEEFFEVSDLNKIRSVIASHPIGHLDPSKDIGLESWLIRLRGGMFNLIKSKAFRSKDLRESVLNLAGSLTEKFGIAWLGLNNSTTGMASKEVRQFVAILVHVSSIEIQILFDDCAGYPEKLSSQHAPVILSCYNVIESIITITCDHIWEVIHEYTKEILDSVNSTMAAIMNYLNEVSVFWEDIKTNIVARNFVVASVRLLSAWMAEETSALREEICTVMPFIIELTKNSMKDTNVTEQAELLRLLLPALCHLSADNLTRPVLMRHNLAELLVNYLETTWKDYNKKLSPSWGDKDDEKMVTICEILLNLIVMEKSEIYNHEIFFQFFKYLYCWLPQLSILESSLVLQANFMVLGLLIARQFTDRLRTCEVSFYKFLSSSIKFLWNAYDIKNEGNRTLLVLSKEYSFKWNDLKELWFLGLQALTSLFAMVPWIGQFLLNSGWPDHLISSLAAVGVNDIDASVKSAYQNFVCCLVKMCPDEFKSLPAVLEVASKHNMKELESLLLAVDISRHQDVSVSP